jgi:hypothetical protein
MTISVAASVCLSLIQSELSGYQGYPRNEAGERRFARALQEVAVSVEHARAILAKFTGEFPSVQEITDTGLNLKSQFEPGPNLRAEWERQYGAPAPTRPDFTPSSAPEYVLRDAAVKEHITRQRGEWPGWKKLGYVEIFEAQEQLGYPLTREQEKMIGR